MRIEAKLAERGLILPKLLDVGGAARLPFAQVRVFGDRAFISGHGPTNSDGSVAEPLGKVGRDLTLEQAYHAAELTVLAMLADLQRALGDLDRITAWLRVFGMVQTAPGFQQTPAVINGCSDLLLAVFGPEVGAHARSAVGMAELPFNIPVEIEAEVAISAQERQ
ncbi:MAG: RidA family protein [Ktedonobacterales bacterium]|jgi:enamine deaminase RidA (YjgF/YER057c/UK114 family)